MGSDRGEEVPPTHRDPEEDQEGEQTGTEELATLESRLEEIQNRAAAGGLVAKRTVSAINHRPMIEVQFGEENLRRDSRLRVGTVEQADELLKISFEEYRVVPGYGAIFASDTGDIEARIRPVGFRASLGIRERPPLDKTYELPGGPQHPGKAITIGEGSALLSMLASPMRTTRGPRTPPAISLRGFSARTPDAAKSVIDEVGSALMFELDLTYGVPFQIVQAVEFAFQSPRGRVSAAGPPAFPRNGYDPEPVALYMYGREAQGMPLLQFLAYYQAIEFYYPRYSEAELRHRLETIVKDPRFSPHRDRDIGRLLNTVLGNGRRAIDNERDQLKSTIRACLREDEVKDFVARNDKRTAFFADRRSPLTKCTISLRDKTIDPRDAAANRIYDLRCKIVHTKDTSGHGEIDLLLPNSPEARLLGEDIALLELIATRVIVASSRELDA